MVSVDSSSEEGFGQSVEQENTPAGHQQRESSRPQ